MFWLDLDHGVLYSLQMDREIDEMIEFAESVSFEQLIDK